MISLLKQLKFSISPPPIAINICDRSSNITIIIALANYSALWSVSCRLLDRSDKSSSSCRCNISGNCGNRAIKSASVNWKLLYFWYERRTLGSFNFSDNCPGVGWGRWRCIRKWHPLHRHTRLDMSFWVGFPSKWWTWAESLRLRDSSRWR